MDTKELIAQGVTGSFIWISCYHNCWRDKIKMRNWRFHGKRWETGRPVVSSKDKKRDRILNALNFKGTGFLVWGGGIVSFFWGKKEEIWLGSSSQGYIYTIFWPWGRMWERTGVFIESATGGTLWSQKSQVREKAGMWKEHSENNLNIREISKSQTSEERRLKVGSVWGLKRVAGDEHPVDNWWQRRHKGMTFPDHLNSLSLNYFCGKWNVYMHSITHGDVKIKWNLHEG